ncbi:unnamed protein product [Effrenium voratum]|nr:unnamed protein product [Effrenium voratum]
MTGLTIIDNFLDEDLRHELLEKLQLQGLSEFEEGNLLGTVNHGTGRKAAVPVPADVVRRMQKVVGSRGRVHGNTVELPALMSRGNVQSHRDAWNGRQRDFVQGLTVLVWLQGGGQLLLQGDEQQHVVDALPGRLVAFDNNRFSHGFRGDGGSRAMLGPMAWHRGGSFRAVMQVSHEEFTWKAILF